jgi:hypothetical protein
VQVVCRPIAGPGDLIAPDLRTLEGRSGAADHEDESARTKLSVNLAPGGAAV